MKVRNLEYFEKLIELKNFSSVADYFNVGQPAISMGIRRLEEDTGHELIIHNSKHNIVILTPAGMILHKHAKVLINQLTEFNNKVSQEL
ncbi:hypothetical protein BGL34_04485 [Fructilactobacillus lindneri]|uniref:HTH lysR-type domain-containing protein n=2 Tax=Fructilactobacillus lindneri TaxID=53444 RepID=A0A0R2JM13_9LACO|nr:LysR family transcriptional regulator [Fructilactobacillus lindneri]ANZ57596.1 hypothetical protein AYR60_01815 [Fructilactobacillus lindneri]ANZ58865.1 hypothetical protein AYR59_01815 [Fructilactobacillus lindneri]KRN78210.1 hypothetical protein IV52_GL001343 [Fructilactobacillus lindneri DSM 20690 = JCM 11027]POG97747.1 hypothetical protein BGL31_05960 [Fructilactobacillus lindneri]POH00028.1 hypothetical protein BGL32_04505 [Fructilactobacillus lindneri]